MTALDTRVNQTASPQTSHPDASPSNASPSTTSPPTAGAPAGPSTFGIGELSAHTGVSARSLRYYEEQGLLAPVRTAAGHRRYDAEAVDRVLLVQRLFAAGLTSTEIAPLLPPLLGRADTAQLDGIASLRIHRHELEDRIARLRDTAEILDEALEEHTAER